MRTGILGILFVCMLMSVSGAEIAIRQPEKPEWKIDLTDSCVRENGVRMADHLSRRRRTVRDDAGAVFRWSVSIDAPKQNAPHGFLLEFDNGDVVESLTVNGRPVARFPVKKPFWPGTERAALLPDAEHFRIEFQVRNLTQLYPSWSAIRGRRGVSPSATAARKRNRPFFMPSVPIFSEKFLPGNIFRSN